LTAEHFILVPRSSSTPLSTANLAKPVKIAVSFRVFPGRDFRTTGTSGGYTDFQNAVFVRAADPVDTTNGPRC